MQNIYTSKSINTEIYSVNTIVLILVLGVTTIGSNSLALGPISPAISEALSISVPKVMAAAAAYGIGTALAAFFLASRIDSHGVHKVLSIAIASMSASFLLSALAPNIYILIIAQFTAGLGAGTALPAIYAYAAAIAPAGRENAVTGQVLSGWTLSLVAGVSLASVVADFLHWRWVYGIFTILAMCSLLLILRIPAPEIVKREGTKVSSFKALTLPRARPLLVICFAYMAAFYGTYGYVGDHIHNVLDQAISASGLIAISYGVGFGLAVFGDPLIDRFGAIRTMPKAYLLIAFVYLALAYFADSFYGLLLLSAFWGAANHFGVNLIVTGLSKIAPDYRGALMGLYSGVTYVAAGIAVVIFGWIYQVAGFAGLAIFAMALSLIAAGVSIWVMWRERKLATD